MHNRASLLPRPLFMLVLRTAIAILFWSFAATAGHQFLHRPVAGGESVMVASMTGWLVATLFLTVMTIIAAWIGPSQRRVGLRGILLIAFWMALLAAGHAFSHEGLMDLAYYLKDAQVHFGALGFGLFVAVYSIALAIPFFPGVEIGIAIIAMFGKSGALASYSGTILGLMLAFFAGRRVPLSWRRAVLRTLRRGKRRGTPPSDLTADREDDPGDISKATSGGQTGLRRGLLPGKAGRFLIRYRYPGIALALNVPGNSAIGGGGGIALMCGMSRHFKTHWFLLTVAIATSPIPFLILTGIIDLEALMSYRGSIHDFLTALEPFFGLR